MKTVMQIVIESYKNDGVSFTDWFMDNYKMLLEKEKEQIEDAYYKDLYADLNGKKLFINAKDYYNKKYNI